MRSRRRAAAKKMWKVSASDGNLAQHFLGHELWKNVSHLQVAPGSRTTASPPPQLTLLSCTTQRGASGYLATAGRELASR